MYNKNKNNIYIYILCKTESANKLKYLYPPEILAHYSQRAVTKKLTKRINVHKLFCGNVEKYSTKSTSVLQ